MSLEKSLENLVAAIEANTAAIYARGTEQIAETPAKPAKPRSKPAKEEAATNAPAEEEAVDYKALRKEVRSFMAANFPNREDGQKLFKEMGVEKFSEVPDEKLDDLLALAKERAGD